MVEMRAIPGQPDYLASEDGRIWSGKRGKLRALRLFQRERGRGYLAVNLTHGGRFKLHSVHVLVALTWHGERPSPSHVVMHRDNDQANNTPDNLCYGLPAENSAQMCTEERQARGERVFGARLTADDVRQIRTLVAGGAQQKALASQYRVSTSTICDVVNRNVWKHIGVAD